MLTRHAISNGKDTYCIELWTSKQLEMFYVSVHLLLVYAIPCIVVMSCHLGLREKLTALSLSSRAAKGEMPLPLPLLHLSSDLPFIIIGLTTKPKGKVSLDQFNDISVHYLHVSFYSRHCFIVLDVLPSSGFQANC